MIEKMSYLFGVKENLCFIIYFIEDQSLSMDMSFLFYTFSIYLPTYSISSLIFKDNKTYWVSNNCIVSNLVLDKSRDCQLLHRQI